jgi:hypothetical protein
MTSWYSVNLKVKNSPQFIFRFQLRQCDVREGVVKQNIPERSQSVTCVIKLRTLLTILSHTANCCGRYKLIRKVRFFSHISHHSCCQLAQVVALSSPPLTVKLSVLLPSSCNAAPLIAKATTHHTEVAFRQHIRWYQVLCCYRVGRPVC